MGAAAAAVLLRRAIRRAFHAVCNLLVLFLLLILMLQDQLQGRVLQQIRHSAVRVLLLRCNGSKCEALLAIRVIAAWRARKSTTSATGIAVSTALCARLAALPTLRGPPRAYRPRRTRQARARKPPPAAAGAQRR